MAEPDLQKVSRIESKITVEVFAVFLLLGLSISAPIMAWNGVWQQDESTALWFQRSGSLTVLFAAWAEYLLFVIGDRISPMSDGGTTYQDLANEGVLKTKYRKTLSVINFVSITLLITGTIIWGYGDLFK
jgi:hypothetical protein